MTHTDRIREQIKALETIKDDIYAGLFEDDPNFKATERTKDVFKAKMETSDRIIAAVKELKKAIEITEAL